MKFQMSVKLLALPYQIYLFFIDIYFFMYTGSLQKFDGVECFTVLNISGGLFRGGVRVGSRGSIEPTDFETLY